MIDINKVELSEKDQNILNVLNVILKSLEVLPNDIAQQTGLSASTVSRVLTVLKKKKMIISVGKETTDKGRRPGLLSFNKKFGQLVHIDVMHDGIAGYIANINGEVIDSERIVFEKDQLILELLLESIGSVYNILKERRKSKKSRILAAGFSVPGLVNEEKRLIQRIPDVFPFSDINVYDYAEQALKVPVVINNASRLGVVGQQIGSYPQCKNLVYINIINSIGIGAGILVNGKLLKGANYLAGEIGDMYFDRNNFSRDPGNSTGQLEEYAGIKSLFRRLTQCMENGGACALKSIMEQESIERLNLKLIERAIELGDRDVHEIYLDVLKVWSIVIINIYLLINPDYVIIGGAVTPEHTKTIEMINNLVSHALYFKPEIRVNALGEKAQLLGGMEVLKQYVFNKILAREAIS